MLKYSVAAAICLAAALSGCERPHHQYPTSRPTVSDLVGTYAPVGDAKVLKQFGSSGRLELLADGSFVMRALPGAWPPGSVFGRDRVWTATGNWEVYPEGEPSYRTKERAPYLLRMEITDAGRPGMGLTDCTPEIVGRTAPFELHWPNPDSDFSEWLILRKVQ